MVESQIIAFYFACFTGGCITGLVYRLLLPNSRKGSL